MNQPHRSPRPSGVGSVTYRTVKVVDKHLFGLYKKTYKIRVSEKKYDDLVRKSGRDDIVNKMTEMIPAIAILGVTSAMARQIRGKKKRKVKRKTFWEKYFGK